jgi:hypothetical protein
MKVAEILKYAESPFPIPGAPNAGGDFVTDTKILAAKAENLRAALMTVAEEGRDLNANRLGQWLAHGLISRFSAP